MPSTTINSISTVDVFEFQKKAFTLFGLNFWSQDKKYIPYSRFMISSAITMNILAMLSLPISTTISMDAIISQLFYVLPHFLGLIRYFFFMYYNQNFQSLQKFLNDQSFRHFDEAANNIRNTEIRQCCRVFKLILSLGIGASFVWYVLPKHNSVTGRFEFVIPEAIYIPDYLIQNYFALTFMVSCYLILISASVAGLGSPYLCNYIMLFKAEFQVCARGYAETISELESEEDVANVLKKLKLNLIRYINLLNEADSLKKTLKLSVFFQFMFSGIQLAMIVVKIMQVKNLIF